jgi:hypothetical protein
LVDDLLEENHAEVNAAGHVGQKLVDEVFKGRAGQAGRKAPGTGLAAMRLRRSLDHSRNLPDSIALCFNPHI